MEHDSLSGDLLNKWMTLYMYAATLVYLPSSHKRPEAALTSQSCERALLTREPIGD